MPVERTGSRYAHNGPVHLAYQVLGQGPHDLVLCCGISHIELDDDPVRTRVYERLASFSRLVVYDQRGMGLSDPVPIPELPDHDAAVADLCTVLDAAGVERATVLGFNEGAPTAIH